MGSPKMTDAERQKRYRDRLRGGPGRDVEPCGTLAAYRRHQRHAETPCGPCKEANADYQRSYQTRMRSVVTFLDDV
jgi:hypothetical protein